MNSAPFERVVKRGQMYYVHKTPPYEGSRELAPKTGRPAIIISRDDENFMSGTVMVVYLTNKDNIRFMRDTQFELSLGGKIRRSVAKCEQIDTVDKQCLGDYIGDIDAVSTDSLDMSLLNGLGLTRERITKLYDLSHSDNNKLKEENMFLTEEVKSLREALDNTKGTDYKEEATRYREEAIRYKQMYKDLLKTIAGKDI